MLQNARGWYAKGIFGDERPAGPGRRLAQGDRAADSRAAAARAGAGLQLRQRPTADSRTPRATSPRRSNGPRSCRRRTSALLKGEVAFGEKVPNPDEGFTQADVQRRRRSATRRLQTIRERLEKFRKERPGGYLVREAPAADVKALKQLLGHVQEGQFVTKFRKMFTSGEMNDDLVIVPAKLGDAVDRSEYTEILPTSPP